LHKSLSKTKNNTRRKAMTNSVLFHYTCIYHLPAILQSGFLKLTDSNLIAPDGTLETELRSKSYKPVVWLTDSNSPEKMGLNDIKMEVKITVARRDYMKYWKAWEPRKEMPLWWRKTFCQGMNVSSWYVSERVVPFSDILKIENRYDGTVYYEAEERAAA